MEQEGGELSWRPSTTGLWNAPLPTRHRHYSLKNPWTQDDGWITLGWCMCLIHNAANSTPHPHPPVPPVHNILTRTSNWAGNQLVIDTEHSQRRVCSSASHTYTFRTTCELERPSCSDSNYHRYTLNRSTPRHRHLCHVTRAQHSVACTSSDTFLHWELYLWCFTPVTSLQRATFIWIRAVVILSSLVKTNYDFVITWSHDSYRISVDENPSGVQTFT